MAGGGGKPFPDPVAGSEPKPPARQRRSGGRHRCRARERKSEREREREGEDDRLDILGPAGYPKADRVLLAIGVPTCLSGRYGSTEPSLCGKVGYLLDYWAADRVLSAHQLLIGALSASQRPT